MTVASIHTKHVACLQKFKERGKNGSTESEQEPAKPKQEPKSKQESVAEPKQESQPKFCRESKGLIIVTERGRIYPSPFLFFSVIFRLLFMSLYSII